MGLQITPTQISNYVLTTAIHTHSTVRAFVYHCPWHVGENKINIESEADYVRKPACMYGVHSQEKYMGKIFVRIHD